jgi:hypothetical protein
VSWLETLILQSASAIRAAGHTVRDFDSVIQERVSDEPLSEWELKYWSRGLQRGLIVLNGHWFRMGSGKFSSYSFFVRNEAGLHVGLRRESIAQAASYVSLITHYGFPRRRVRFESEFLDVAVTDEWGRTILYAESKASGRTLERLIERLSHDFQQGLPPVPEGEKPSDPWQKASHILRKRPEYFWAVSPRLRCAYKVHYTPRGFTLQPMPDIPSSNMEGLFKTRAAVPTARLSESLSDGSTVSIFNLAATLR